MLGRSLAMLPGRAARLQGLGPDLAPARVARAFMDAAVSHNLAIKPRAGSSITPERLAAQTAAWSLRLSHENTLLSWGRNAIISTVAGVALVQYRKNEGRPPRP
mmetsp:Transcript_12256/g.30893  ORF Transcript_12256/g.30893 Transcript_12256/m.30893 type:complete len:104 (-) Transcript_12256:821-1132(-)